MKIIRVISYSFSLFLIIGAWGALSVLDPFSLQYLIMLAWVAASLSVSIWLFKRRGKDSSNAFRPLIPRVLNIARVTSYILTGYGVFLSATHWLFRDEFLAMDAYYANTPGDSQGGGDYLFGYVAFTVVMSVSSAVLWWQNKRIKTKLASSTK